MKFNKKTAAIAAFALGAVILATSAFADILLGSGYNSLKDTMKTTAIKLTEEINNFTIDATVTFKLDGRVIEESNSSAKFDMIDNARESTDKNFRKGETSETYWYRDKDRDVYRNNDGSYHVTERRKTDVKDWVTLNNPFEDERFKDAERVVDAFIGNLKDVIEIEETGGQKMYTGSITKSEIPSLINALSSFVFKYSILDQWHAKHLGVPSPKSNIYLADVMGKAIENEDGIIEKAIFTASMSAQDDKGFDHIYTFDITMDIKDINSTIVKAPNLDGKDVSYSVEGFDFEDKHVGKYKNDIVIEEGNSFKKIGERVVEINSVAGGSLKGRYYEIYEEGHGADEIREFDFSSSHERSWYYTMIEYTDNKGDKKKGAIHRNGMQNIYVSLNIEMNEDGNGYSYVDGIGGFDESFIRVFE